MLTEEQAQDIKQKLINHIESTFPAEQIANAKQQVQEMDLSQLESFLEKNNIIKEEIDNECVFCSIVLNKIKSCKIAENSKAIAILEINPISKGHTIILAKTHDPENQKEVITLGEKVSTLLKSRLNAKEIKTLESRIFGHQVLNLLPVYDKEDFNSSKRQTTLEELEKIKQEIEKVEEVKIKERKTRVKKIKEKLWLPKRIP
jgi:histidine triad (HIT) family protein